MNEIEMELGLAAQEEQQPMLVLFRQLT